MYELNTEYTYDNLTIIVEDDKELDRGIPLEQALLMKLFTLK